MINDQKSEENMVPVQRLLSGNDCEICADLCCTMYRKCTVMLLSVSHHPIYAWIMECCQCESGLSIVSLVNECHYHYCNRTTEIQLIQGTEKSKVPDTRRFIVMFRCIIYARVNSLNSILLYWQLTFSFSFSVVVSKQLSTELTKCIFRSMSICL